MGVYYPQRQFRVLLLVGSWVILACLIWTIAVYSSHDSKLQAVRDNKMSSIRRVEESPAKPSPAKHVNTTLHATASLDGPSSHVPSSPFYHFPVNCSAIFDDNTREIQHAELLLRTEKQKNKDSKIPIPNDDDIASFSENCTYYKEARDYPTKVLSKEEENFPLAFIILTHRNAAQTELLLRSIYQPHNVYAIHPDAKSPPVFLRAIKNLARCFDNVFVCSKLEAVKYAGFTRLLADINCMKDLVKHKVKWRYVINQCGEAFPLKTNLEMVRQIKAYHGRNDAEGYVAPHKLGRFHVFSPKRRQFKSANEMLQRYPPPNNISLFSGNAYNTLSRKFVEYVLNDELPVKFLEWINMTYSPDEHFWSSLQRVPSAPGSYTNVTHKDINTSFVKWAGETFFKPCKGTFVRGICVMGTAYLPYVARLPHLFANKFHYSYDPITMQCMQELLTNRTYNPKLTMEYYPEFPAKRKWY
ncbi:beta-1,3-galactosyl-O-glycosyl-glycoprotein beta-1,6-N-acetylglucosaminyltransferase 4-like [Diadema setosum]|uniref:beta-1,3-galactosyl-O-glycosyl-glycoprotein beta-1,6-N-acetylglucosaminyltransferase 4-like n=1 Tax=Diadema setosum TaxID=31175 RepID=UPI003B3A24DB